jgi:diketogulonate reductase-like aldo/keto reductase
MADQKWVTTSAGVKMPCIIYGTAWKKERTVELVSKALRVGFRGVDTACQPKHYDERLVGVALQRMGDEGVEREVLYLQTKFTPFSSQDPENVPYDTAASLEEQVAQSFEVSKRNLQTTYVDSLLLHSPLASHELTMRAWRAMEIIQKAGGARQLGISNCYEMDVMMALYSDAEVKPAVLQNRFDKESGYDVGLRRWCNSHGVAYQSFWSLTANPTVLGSDAIRALAQSYKKTEAQIFFRYLIHSGITPLTGTSSEQHMREDLGVFDFELSSQELNGITLLLN